jgi:hypothetical protein
MALLNTDKKPKKEPVKRKLTVDLPPSHFIRLFGTWCSGLTDGYEDYQIAGALWLLSALCGGKVSLKMKQGIIKPNLFITIFGKSTTSRKSTVVQKTREVYEAVTGELLYNEDFSIEGYLESLDKNSIQHHVRDEAAGFLAKTHLNYNSGFSEMECAIYDGQSFKKTLSSHGKGEPKVFEFKNPYVTKFYATTPDNYFRYMNLDDFLSGRELRNLFCFPEYKKDRKPLGMQDENDNENWTALIGHAALIQYAIEEQEEISFTFADEALEYYSKITADLEDEADKLNDGLLSSAVGRSEIHILKIAMLIELGKYEISFTITKESIETAARMVINYFLPTLIYIRDEMQEDIKNNQVERVTAVLKRLGGTAQHSKLLHDSKLKAKEFSEVIETLKESGTIKSAVLYGNLTHYTLIETNTSLEDFIIPPNSQSSPNSPIHELSYRNEKVGKKELNNIDNINNNKYKYTSTQVSVRELENSRIWCTERIEEMNL